MPSINVSCDGKISDGLTSVITLGIYGNQPYSQYTHTHTKLLLSRKLTHIVTENVDSTYFDIMNHTVSAELPVSLLQDS